MDVTPLSSLLEAAALADARFNLMGDQLKPGAEGARSFGALEAEVARLRDALVDVGWRALQAYRTGGLGGQVPQLSPAQVAEPIPEVSTPESTPESTPAAAPSVRAQITSEALAALQRSLSSGDGLAPLEPEPERVEAPPKDDATLWAEHRALPTELGSARAFGQHFSRIQSILDGELLEGWRRLPDPVQAQLAAFFVAQIRHLQAQPRRRRPAHALGEGAFGNLISRLCEVVGHAAQGATRRKTPEHYSWLADAEDLRNRLDAVFTHPERLQAEVMRPFSPERGLDELRGLIEGEESGGVVRLKVLDLLSHGVAGQDPRLLSLLEDHHDALVGSELRTVRSKLRKRARAAAVEAPVDVEAWAHAAQMVGKRVTLVGGDRRGEPLERLRRALPGCELEWVETSRTTGLRQVQALAERINYGSVDCVLIVQRFMSHTLSKAIMDVVRHNPHGVKVATVTKGYGQVQLLSALGRCLEVA